MILDGRSFGHRHRRRGPARGAGCWACPPKRCTAWRPTPAATPPWRRSRRQGRPSDHPLIVHVADACGTPTLPAGSAFAQNWSMRSGPARSSHPPAAPGVATLPPPADRTVICAALPPGGACRAGACAAPGDGPLNPVARPVASGRAQRQPLWPRSPTTALACVQDELGETLLVLDGGPCRRGHFIDHRGLHARRAGAAAPGAITREQIAGPAASTAIQRRVAIADPARLWHAGGPLRPERQGAPDGRQGLQNGPGPAGRRCRAPGGVRALAAAQSLQPGAATGACPTMQATARQLFAVLRSFDDAGVRLIWAEPRRTRPPG